MSISHLPDNFPRHSHIFYDPFILLKNFFLISFFLLLFSDFSLKMGSSSLFTVRRLMLCSAVILMLLHRTTSAPVDEALARCTPGSPRRNTCEKCAKVTRDDEAYLLCCTQEGTQQWCEDFLNFTLRP